MERINKNTFKKRGRLVLKTKTLFLILSSAINWQINACVGLNVKLQEFLITNNYAAVLLNVLFHKC